MNKKLTDKVSFHFIRYANCWEDASILMQGLSPQPGSKILSIGSAGDNSFMLLFSNPKIVVAVDVNEIQLHLIALKKAAIKALSYQELLMFLGFYPCSNRLEIYQKVKSELPENTLVYWDEHLAQIADGIINQGKFEKYFRLFSRKILPFIHSKKTIERLFVIKSAQEQEIFYSKKWNTWRWRLFFKLFFSKQVMGKYGRDPQFLKQVKVSVADYIFNKAENHLKSINAQNNFILRYCLTGSFGNLLPDYLLPENYQIIKKNIDKIELYKGYAEDAINKYGKFDSMNLSNIFEYMDDDMFNKTAANLVEGLNPSGKMAYWNLMVPRRISDILPEKIKHNKQLSDSLTRIDKGFFYNQFILDEMK